MEQRSWQQARRKLDPPDAAPKAIKDPDQLAFQIAFVLFTSLFKIVKSIFEYYLFTPQKSIKDDVVLVTGAGRGLGRALALQFAKNGCKVCCVDIDGESNDESAQLINQEYPNCARAYTADISLPESFHSMADLVEQDFGRVDILVNNAGVIAGGSILQMQDEDNGKIIDVNLLSHFRLIRRFLPGMLKRNKGHIVAVSSVLSLTGIAYATAYVASKWAVTGMMESLQEELRKIPGNRVTTSCICPYFINTSATYTKSWSIRVPELSVETAAKIAISGIRRNDRLFTIPRWIYWPFVLRKLIPNRLNDSLKDILYTEFIFPTPKPEPVEGHMFNGSR